MRKKAKETRPSAEFRAKEIAYRVSDHGVTAKPINYEPSELYHILDFDQPRITIKVKGGATEKQAIELLRSVIARIEGSGFPETDIAVPGEIMTLIEQQESAMETIFARLENQSAEVRESVLTYLADQGLEDGDDE